MSRVAISDSDADNTITPLSSMVLAVSERNLASIRKSGPEIKNRCTLEGVNRENPASIRKSGPEIKNRCRFGVATTVCRRNHSSLQRRRLESDATRCCGRDRCHDYAAGGLFFDVATMVLHRFPSLGLNSRIDVRRRLFPRVLTELAESLHRKKKSPSLA